MCTKFIKFENDDMVEIQFREKEPYIVGNFKFLKDDITVSHPTSFRKWKKISFSLPVLVDLPINGNVETNNIYEVIGEALKIDFINFLKEKNKTV
jgi:hypothetical protein